MRVTCFTGAPPSAANKAQEAYNTAFPPEKRREVVLFCKQELFAHFGHNLRSTPQSLVAILSVKMEKLEAAEMHERVLAMTLAAVARVFTFLSAAGDDGSQSPLHELEGEAAVQRKAGGLVGAFGRGKATTRGAKIAKYVFLPSVRLTLRAPA